MLRTAPLLLAALALAGCVDSLLPPSGVPGASHWEAAVEPSMAPDFTGMGETYPILLVHKHHLASERQREAWANVVCSTTEGEEIELVPSARADAAASSPCAGPPADPATGRVYMARAAFRERKADAVGAILGGCGGGLLFFDEAQREVLVQTPAHDFHLARHDNGTFSVDGTWIRPGTALKLAYFINHGSARDEEYVRVVFDHPGEWLVGRVAGYDEEVDGGIPPRPSEGTGLVAEAPHSPESPSAVLDATLARTPGRVHGIEALRMVHEGERLTEATVRYATDRGSVTWYGAGRTGGVLRLLGAQEPAGGAPHVPVDAFLEAFDRPWTELREGLPGSMTDVRLDPATAWTGTGDLRVVADPVLRPVACREGCVLVLETRPLRGASWGVLLMAQRVPAEDALTLHVVGYPDGPVSLWWHVPPA